ncbi:A/G-specific DNA-adenine glycosylase [Gemmobacter caeni]|uniref:Adenine DNA glycosylase n=2 Tax=Gemmobacter TaxID=204456 RepID=A0A2T6B4V4_9RHOB|nr:MULTISPECIES: A/G-specific adenine glycosylase [Gemmobacter]PTX51106.1 A/G-specific DNA-adenine glycosylase [Gemmobacter caeni]TWJ01106.1 A/G-specific DNA-adenine glycosylase [Gemmobacter caeni]GHC18274.1 A/G-specific adenine glycosylase [Gemmobacter nanjingensis]
MTDPATVQALLLAWYDRHHRIMPWRVSPADRAAGAQADPYRVWLSEVMLQQTTVAAVRDYFHRFTARWPDVAALAAAEDAEVMAEWAGLGYYARARNLLKCARAVATDHGGRFPDTREGLLSLPGVGPYTAAAVASIAFDRAETVVDGNVERVMARLFQVEEPLPGAKPVLVAHAARLTPAERPGDYAQAVMDLGATICTPRNPACAICPLSTECTARAAGVQAELPRKTQKPAKPQREGVLWIALRPDGAVLLEERPQSGLLGGMAGFPTSGWDGSTAPAPLKADWQRVGEVRHTFTHFHLVLEILTAVTEAQPERGTFLPRAAFRPAALPTVMRKGWDLVPRDITGG